MSQKLLLPASPGEQPKKVSPRKLRQSSTPLSRGDQLERLWDDLLSAQPERVRAAYHSLDLAGQQSVLAHLQQMAGGAGWQPQQRLSAQAAIKALKGHVPQE